MMALHKKISRRSLIAGAGGGRGRGGGRRPRPVRAGGHRRPVGRRHDDGHGHTAGAG